MKSWVLFILMVNLVMSKSEGIGLVTLIRWNNHELLLIRMGLGAQAVCNMTTLVIIDERNLSRIC